MKADYKNLTGSDYKPGSPPAAPKEEAPSKEAPTEDDNMGDAKEQELFAQVAAQGDKVRNLKSNKASKVRNGKYI